MTRRPAASTPAATPTLDGERRLWRYLVIGALALATVLLVAGVAVVTVSRLTATTTTPGSGVVSAATLRAQAVARDAAARWVADEVSHSAVVSCDPVMCRALVANKFPAGQLLTLGPAAPYPLNSAVVVATPTIRSQFGSSLGAAYAPAILARFGSGNALIDIRVVSRSGAATYQAALNADMASRKDSGASLLQSNVIAVSGTPARQLIAGKVDARLIVTIAYIASLHPVTIVAFGDSGPGASAGMPFRYVDLTRTNAAAPTRSSAYVKSVLATLSALPNPFHPSRVELVQLHTGQTVLRVLFAAPTPLGLNSPPK